MIKLRNILAHFINFVMGGCLLYFHVLAISLLFVSSNDFTKSELAVLGLILFIPCFIVDAFEIGRLIKFFVKKQKTFDGWIKPFSYLAGIIITYGIHMIINMLRFS